MQKLPSSEEYVIIDPWHRGIIVDNCFDPEGEVQLLDNNHDIAMG